MKESHFGEVLFVFYLVRLQGLSGHVPLHLSQVLIINQLLPQFIWRLTSCNFPPLIWDVCQVGIMAERM